MSLRRTRCKSGSTKSLSTWKGPISIKSLYGEPMRVLMFSRCTGWRICRIWKIWIVYPANSRLWEVTKKITTIGMYVRISLWKIWLKQIKKHWMYWIAVSTHWVLYWMDARNLPKQIWKSSWKTSAWNVWKSTLSPDVKKEVSWMHLRLLWKKEVLHLKKYRGESMSIRWPLSPGKERTVATNLSKM